MMPDTELKSKNTHEAVRSATLPKAEILRGYGKFSEIFKDSVCLSSDLLKVYISRNNSERKVSEITPGPLLTGKVKVGFVVAKKKIPKAVRRNRARRLLRESFRLNKHIFEKLTRPADLILTFTDKGYDYISGKNRVTLSPIMHDMILLFGIVSKQTGRL